MKARDFYAPGVAVNLPTFPVYDGMNAKHVKLLTDKMLYTSYLYGT